MRELHLDYEGVSKVDLKKCGTDVYSRHPSTKVLMLAWGFSDSDVVRVWEPHLGPMPAELRAAFTDPSIRKIAHNAAFEIAITRNVLKIPTDPRQWRCVMVMALSLGLPGKLELLVRDALQLGRQYWKDPEGDKLMRLFSFPSSRATWESHPVEWAKYVGYCRQDVVAEKRAYKVTLRYVENIDQLFEGWVLDQRINVTGLPVDYGFITAAKTLADEAKKKCVATLKEWTGLQNPNSTKQLAAWLHARGYPFASLAKNRAQIAMRAEDGELTDEAKKVLQLRFDSNKTSLAKFDALERASFMGRLRGTFQYYGAAATGRWAGRILGQNMPRPWKGVEAFLAEVRQMIADYDLEGLEFFFGKPLDAIVSSIRSSIKAPEGKKFVVADLASIELVVIAWLTDASFWLDVVRSGKDAYKAFAEQWLGVPYAEVTKQQRNDSKPPALGCFAADTKILTKRGWIPIIEVSLDDEVFDGVEFVAHGGVIYQGRKAVIDMAGVSVTPDHLILCGENEWLQAQHVAQEVSTSTVRATAWATGLFSRSNALKKAAVEQAGTTAVSAKSVGPSTSSGKATLSEAKQVAASPAPAGLRTNVAVRCTAELGYAPETWSGCLTVFTRCAHGALAAAGLTLRMRAEESGVSSGARKSSSDMPSPSTVGTTRTTTSTASRATVTTLQATSDSAHVRPTNATSVQTFASTTKALRTSLKIFTAFFARTTATLRQSLARYERAKPPIRSSQGKPAAEAHTYDIVDAGPRHRFAVQTNLGPMIAHNCGYRMGPGREVGVFPDTEKTGLWGYGANMGIDLTKEQCKTAVKVYRNLSPEIVEWWHLLERAALECVAHGEPQQVGRIIFDLKAPFLRMRLPSGRCVHYCRPRIEQVEIEFEDEETGEIIKTKKVGLTYERASQTSGKWVRRANHGGRFIEQAVQAIARDILEIGLINADAHGFEVVGHYHDEILTLVDVDSPLGVEDLIECMTRLPKWAAGMPCRAEGYEDDFYHK